MSETIELDKLRVEVLTVGEFQANCYLCLPSTGQDALVIDPGDEGERIVEVLQQAGRKPSLIVNTHGHIDHISANGALKDAFPDAVLCIHEDDAEALRRPLKNLSLLGGRLYRKPQADKLLKDGDALKMGGLSFQVIHTPGHTPGGSCLLCPDCHSVPVLFSGDTLFAGSVGRTDFPGGNWSVLQESIKNRLLALPDDTIVLPGHGPATTIGAERNSNEFLMGF